MRRYAAITFILLIAACGGNEDPSQQTALLGQWGGLNGELFGLRTSVVVTFACDAFTFPGPIEIASNGAFSANGTATSSTQAAHIGWGATMSGRVSNDSMFITFTRKDGSGASLTPESYTFLPSLHATYNPAVTCAH